MVTISRRELERAYWQHRQVYRDEQMPTSSHYLLLFYAVECGLKAILMRRQNATNTEQLGSENFGHDLNIGLDKLRVSHLRVPQAQIRSQTVRPVAPANLHQAWRYGATLQDDEIVVSQLKAIIAWIEQEMVNP